MDAFVVALLIEKSFEISGGIPAAKKIKGGLRG